MLERAVILCEGDVVLAEHLGTLSRLAPAADSFLTLKEVERQHILRALEKTGGVLAGPAGRGTAARHEPFDRLVTHDEASASSSRDP